MHPETLFRKLFTGIFDPSILIVFKTCFYWGYTHEYYFISNWNHVDPSSNEKVIFKIVIVGLGRNSKTTLSCRLFLSRFGIASYGIFKTYVSTGDIPMNLISFGFGITLLALNKYFINKIPLGSLAGQHSSTGKK
jgi:hypothetical protein